MSNERRRITIFLLERLQLSRTGFRLIFQTDPSIEIVGEADDLDEAMEDVLSRKPNVVLLRSDAAERDVQYIAHLKVTCPEINVLVLTDHVEQNVISKFIGAGASGVCSRNVNVDNLLVAVQAVAAGGMWFGPTAASVMRSVMRGELSLSSQYARSPDMLTIPGSLTDRENEILRRVAQGLTNQQIAERLHLSVETVKTYIRRIMDKSSIRSRRELVARYRKASPSPNV